MTTAQRNRELLKIKNPGELTIFTVVNGDYVWYIPMFIYAIKKAYPDCKLRIIADTDDKDILLHKEVLRVPMIVSEDSGYRAACTRFLYDDDTLINSDYVLITDIDMMFYREEMSIVDQHMLDLRFNDLECYSNCTTNGDRCPGVHFVTKDWWRKTEDARQKEAEKLSDLGVIPWDYDEQMLRRIIISSGLKEPPAGQNLWAFHGVHIGEYRHKIRQGDRKKWKVTEHSMALVSDDKFVEIAMFCDSKVPQLQIKQCLEEMK